MESYRILIADDHSLSRQAICSVLEKDKSFLIVGEATNGEEAVFLSEELKPDVVLMDIHMPVCDGLQATKKIKRNHAHIKIVILSVSDDIADLFTAVQCGAQGYLLKNMDPDEWLSYLHTLLESDQGIPRTMANRLFHQFRSTNLSNEINPDILTSREKEILALVASGTMNRHIAEQLVITENTVKNHIKNVLEKLHLDNRVQLAAYAMRHGIIHVD